MNIQTLSAIARKIGLSGDSKMNALQGVVTFVTRQFRRESGEGMVGDGGEKRTKKYPQQKVTDGGSYEHMSFNTTAVKLSSYQVTSFQPSFLVFSSCRYVP
ncbi:MAG: hypothetical protein ACXAC5_25275 [Promethearchaeota archaeon]|jgi:hypothetical protein